MDRKKFIDDIRDKVLHAIAPIKPGSEAPQAEMALIISARRTQSGNQLPPYYFVYFLLAELLQFKDRGKFDKTAWSFTIDFNGEAFLIEYRKFGIGVFARDAERQNDTASKIVHLIKKGVFLAKPFFELLAKEAVEKSKINVVNQEAPLFERYNYFLDEYKMAVAENEAKEAVRKAGLPENVGFAEFQKMTGRSKNADWLAMAAIDAFFSWTEHIFIHIAILNGAITEGDDVASLAQANWLEKYKTALPLNEGKNKAFYDKLSDLRRQLRNYVAHGAFGKEGEAFSFHSNAGAVPVVLHPKKSAHQFSIGQGLYFRDTDAIASIEAFVKYLIQDGKNPALFYIQSGLPIILPHASDGLYARLTTSIESMEEYVNYLCESFDNAANMDW